MTSEGQPPEVRSLADSQRPGSLQVEAAGAHVLLQDVAESVDPVLHADGPHRVSVPLDPVTILQLDDLQRKPELVHPQVHRLVEEPLRRNRPVQDQLLLPPHHPQGAQEADDSQVVVGVEVREEHRVHREPGPVADHLPLAALATIEEQEVRVRLHRQAREVPVDRRLGGRRAEKGEAQE